MTDAADSLSDGEWFFLIKIPITASMEIRPTGNLTHRQSALLDRLNGHPGFQLAGSSKKS
jgi:hypothetical protein